MTSSNQNDFQKSSYQEEPVPTIGGTTPGPFHPQPPSTEGPFHPQPPSTEVPWSTGLCDCSHDVSNCCMTCWCPCVTFGRIAEIVDRGSTSCGASGVIYGLICCVIGCPPCYYSCFYRSKMRRQYMLQNQPCGDCLVHCFCEYCALCQEYRQLESQGIDMILGWEGNKERQNYGVEMPPAVAGMSRY